MTLITAAELAERLADADTCERTAICDVRFYLADAEQGRREYDAGHIPGAIFVDLAAELAAPAGQGHGGGRHPLPEVADFTALLGRIGVDTSTFVVAYDSAGGATAARLWWMLRSIGHGQVAVLDGGLPAWIAAQPTTTEPGHRDATVYRDVAEWSGIVDAAAVAEGVALGAAVVDSRAPERYRGDVEPIDPKAGHIPGAINRFHNDNLTTDGHHRPIAELAQRFAGLGERPIVYCGSGVTACHNLLAMSLVGINQARLYPGSWSDWSSDPDRPVATGD